VVIAITGQKVGDLISAKPAVQFVIC